jgi:hypothetical protein
MGQEFFIKSSNLEDKVRQILPSQGGLGANFDLSASTQIIPVVDLTESAEGSNLRQDLQTSFGFNTTSAFSIANSSQTIISNTGYFRIFGSIELDTTGNGTFNITDGASTKILLILQSSSGIRENLTFDFNVFLRAGDSITASSSAASVKLNFITRQLATINGELVDP